MSNSSLIDKSDMPMSGALNLIIALDDRWTIEERYQAVMIFISMVAVTAANGKVADARKNLDEFHKAAKRMLPEIAAGYSEAESFSGFIHSAAAKQ